MHTQSSPQVNRFKPLAKVVLPNSHVTHRIVGPKQLQKNGTMAVYIAIRSNYCKIPEHTRFCSCNLVYFGHCCTDFGLQLDA